MLDNGLDVALIGLIVTFYLSRLSYDYFQARLGIRINTSKQKEKKRLSTVKF